MSAPKLYYFNGRGHGAIVRLMLAASGIEFTEELLTDREQFLRLISEGKLLFSQVLLLEIDGLQLVQTDAIVRYVARKGGLLGKSDNEAARIDMLYEGTRDFCMPFLVVGFLPKDDVTEKTDKAMNKYLPIFEKVLKDNGTGFLTGDSMTVADVGLLEPLLILLELKGQDALKDHPSVDAFHKKMTSLSSIAAFLASSKRKRPNDDVYIASVKKILDKTSW